MRIGIIGGKGIMGSMFKRVFETAGFDCDVSDINTKTTNSDIVKNSDAVVFSLPISETVKVIEELLPLVRADQILMDLTSVKEAPLKSMLKSKAEVLGLHPMFGPGLETVKGQLVVYCQGRKGEKADKILAALKSAGLILKEVEAAKHDELMSVVQGLNHLSALVTAKAMSDIGQDLNDLIDVGTPVFKIRNALLSRLMSQSPSLYADISISNPHVREVAKALRENTEEICKILESADKESFLKFFSEASDYFSGNKESGLQQSNMLIQYFLNL